MSYIDAFTIGTDGLFSTDSQQFAMQGLLGEDYEGTCGHNNANGLPVAIVAAFVLAVSSCEGLEPQPSAYVHAVTLDASPLDARTDQTVASCTLSRLPSFARARAVAHSVKLTAIAIRRTDEETNETTTQGVARGSAHVVKC